MKQIYFPKYLVGVMILSNLAFECGCKKPNKQISHLNLSITFQKEVIYLEEGRVPFTLTIKSNDGLAKETKYRCTAWLVNENLGKIVSTSGEAIDPGYELVYGDNQLYYHPQGVGKHVLEISVSDENGSLQKKQLVDISVKDHFPIDFQVEFKLEKSSVFIHESVKVIVDISSRHKEAEELTYKIKEISTDKKGAFSATEQGTPIGPSHELSYGKNILYYNNIDKQRGVHDIKLIISNSKGDTQTILPSFNVLDTNFQLKLQLQKTPICFYEKAKLIVDITSNQVGLDKLDYQIKEISTSVEGGEFFTTAEGSKTKTGDALLYGKNTLYYHPHGKLGTHEIKLIVTNSNGNTQTVLTSLEVLDVDFQVKLTPEKPTIFFYEVAKMKVEITSSQEGSSDKLSYQIQKLNTSKEGYFSLTPEGEAISQKQVLSYGKSQLYYHPKEQLGTHDIKLVVANENGNSKTILTSLEVLDVDFQVKFTPEKPTIFFYEVAKMKLDITSSQEGNSDKLNYQIQKLSTSKEGYFSLTPEGEAISEKQVLSYGKSQLYYHPKEQLGTHDIKLVIANEKGNSKTILTSLEVLDVDFQVKFTPEKPTIFFYEEAKMKLDITSSQGGSSDKLNYQIQELSTSKKGSFSLTSEGEAISQKQVLSPGKNTLYYHPNRQLGIHEIKLIITNSNGNTQTVLTSLEVLDVDFQVKLTLEKPTIFFYEKAKVNLEISSPQQGGDKLTYQIQELSTNKKGSFSLTSEGEAISKKQILNPSKSQLYYHTNGQLGTHEIKLIVTNSNGNTKTVLASLEVLDIDFLVKVKLEKTQSFSSEPIKLMVDISSKQEGSQHPSVQLKEIKTSIKGGKFLTAATNGTPILTGQTLNYGTNIWYYIPHEGGKHDIQLIAVSKHGTIKEANFSLDVADPNFELEIKPEKTTIFSHEQVKLIINICSTQKGVDKLVYQLKEVNTNIETGQLSATPEGTPLSSGQALQYGKNSWYYIPHQPGNHTIQLTVANNKSTTQKATAVLMVNQATFSKEVKIEKPAKSADANWEVGLLLKSNSALKEEKWGLASWQIEEPGVGRLQDTGGYQVAEKGVLLQGGLNKFNLVLSERIELKNVPLLKLTIRQPDGKDELLIADLSKYVFSYLEKGMGLLIEQYQVAYQKVVDKEPFAQDKFDRVNQQLQTLHSNLNILAQSTTINRDQLEDALARINQAKLALSRMKSTVNVLEWEL